jgi:hypothetical protein
MSNDRILSQLQKPFKTGSGITLALALLLSLPAHATEAGDGTACSP